MMIHEDDKRGKKEGGGIFEDLKTRLCLRFTSRMSTCFFEAHLEACRLCLWLLYRLHAGQIGALLGDLIGGLLEG